MARRTKILCTLGPASSDPEVLRQMMRAGMDLVRLNFSHGSHAEHAARIKTIRQIAREERRAISILQDLQGPKIRVGKIEGDSVLLHQGDPLRLKSEEVLGNAERVSISYPTLAEDVEVGGRILMDDGLLEMEITGLDGKDVLTEVVVGGILRSRKGVNLPDIKTSTPSLTEKDIEDLEFGLEQGVDLIALSFVRAKQDVADLVERIRQSGKRVAVVAKIEKPEAVRQFDSILQETDGVMVARGDLGIEMPMSQVPGVQKRIIDACRRSAKPVITATQMLESMVENPRPTRAEASDVANAVLDGSDVLMLSAETAIGSDPARVVRVMAQIIEDAETLDPRRSLNLGMETENGLGDVTESVAKTACEIAEQIGARCICCLTATGTTARTIARHRPDVPVYAFTDDVRVVGQLGLVWGTEAFAIPFQKDTDEGVTLVIDSLVQRGLVDAGDLVVMTAGMPLPAKGRTNMVHVTRA